jgi:hypothetical protein
MAALLMGNDANPVQAVGMGRLSGQDAPVELPGFRKTAFLVALNRGGEHLAAPGGRTRGLGLATGAALLADHGSFSEREGSYRERAVRRVEQRRAGIADGLKATTLAAHINASLFTLLLLIAPPRNSLCLITKPLDAGSVANPKMTPLPFFRQPWSIRPHSL